MFAGCAVKLLLLLRTARCDMVDKAQQLALGYTGITNNQNIDVTTDSATAPAAAGTNSTDDRARTRVCQCAYVFLQGVGVPVSCVARAHNTQRGLMIFTQQS